MIFLPDKRNWKFFHFPVSKCPEPDMGDVVQQHFAKDKGVMVLGFHSLPRVRKSYARDDPPGRAIYRYNAKPSLWE
jgi:hypothetical protein